MLVELLWNIVIAENIGLSMEDLMAAVWMSEETFFLDKYQGVH